MDASGRSGCGEGGRLHTGHHTWRNRACHRLAGADRRRRAFARRCGEHPGCRCRARGDRLVGGTRQRDGDRLAAGIRCRSPDHCIGYTPGYRRHLAVAGARLDRNGRRHAGPVGRALRAGRSETSALHRHRPRRHAVRPQRGAVRALAFAHAAAAGAGLRRRAQSGRRRRCQGRRLRRHRAGKALLEGHLDLDEALAC